MEPRRRIVVFGAGAVGGYLGARLSNAGNDVTLVGRQRVVEAIERQGLIVRDGEDEVVSHPRATSSIEGLTADLILLTVRTFDVPASLGALRQLLSPGGFILAFQNGVGTEDDLAASLGSERVIAATLTISAGMEEPGVITVYGHGGVAFATMDASPVPAWLLALFSDAGLTTQEVHDYRSLRWSKLLLNMLAAPTSAVLDEDIEQIARDTQVFRLEQEAFQEALRVMKALGIGIVDLPGYRVRRAKLVMRMPWQVAKPLVAPKLIKARSGHSPGMRSDMKRGKTEIGAFNGAIVRSAREAGLRVPVNEILTKLTQELAVTPESREFFRGRPDRLVELVREGRLSGLDSMGRLGGNG